MLVFSIRPFSKHAWNTRYSILITGAGRMKMEALLQAFSNFRVQHERDMQLGTQAIPDMRIRCWESREEVAKFAWSCWEGFRKTLMFKGIPKPCQAQRAAYIDKDLKTLMRNLASMARTLVTRRGCVECWASRRERDLWFQAPAWLGWRL